MSTCFLCLICLVFVYIITSHADCNLLSYSEGKPSYIDTESKDSIIAMCSGRDISTLSKWEEYQCSYISNRIGVKTCWPQRRMSYCSPGNLKGAIFLYHGFSACPDYYNSLAPQLQAECWHVYQPLIIGHGYNFCNSSSDPSCTAGKYNITELPESRQPYIDYVNMMIEVINDEVSIMKQCELNANPSYQVNNIEVAVGGLSFGGPIASAIAVLSDSVITKQLLFSPIFLALLRSLDDTVYDLLNVPLSQGLEVIFEAFAPSITGTNDGDTLSDIDINVNVHSPLHSAYMTFVVFLNDFAEFLAEETSDSNFPLLADLLDTVMFYYGTPICETDIKRGRGGFCQFKIRHIAAVISFSKYAMELVIADNDYNHNNDEVDTLLMLSERDEITWNSFAANYVYYFYDNDQEIIKNESTNCMWLIAKQCDKLSDDDNRCGVPHSFFTEYDNIEKPPHYLYWNKTLINGVAAWLNNEEIDNDNFMTPLNDWDGTRNQCVDLDLIHPSKKLLFLSDLKEKLDEFANVDYNKILYPILSIHWMFQ